MVQRGQRCNFVFLGLNDKVRTNVGRLGNHRAQIRPYIDTGSETVPRNLRSRKETYKKKSVGDSG